MAATKPDTKLSFYINGKKETLETHEFHPRMTLIEYLREKAIGLTGARAPRPHAAPWTGWTG